MQYRQDIVLPNAYLFPTAGWMGLHYYRVLQKTQKYVSQISEKSHFEIRHYRKLLI